MGLIQYKVYISESVKVESNARCDTMSDMDKRASAACVHAAVPLLQ